MEILPSGLPKLVDDEEDLARFLTSRSDFFASRNDFATMMVKPAVFLPNPKDGKKSVFRHGSEPQEELLRIGREHIAADRNIHGVAICKARHIRAVKLDVIAEEPPPRHANIEGWPWMAGDKQLEKSQQLSLAQEIAREAEVIRF